MQNGAIVQSLECRRTQDPLWRYDRRIVKALIAALLLAAAYGGETGGRLFVHVSPGFEVIVDDASVGISTSDEGGKLIRNLAPGPHHVVVRSTDGREGSFNVTIVEGQTRDIAVSPLGLRKKFTTSVDDETGSLHVVCIPEDCTIQFRGSTKEKRGADELVVDAIPPGKYPLAASRGSKTLRTDVDVQKGMIVTVEANLTVGSTRVVDTRRRTHRLVVAEANDALTTLAIPPHWKTAIRGALPAGVSVIKAVSVGDGVQVTMRVPSDDVGVSLIRSLATSTAFTKVVLPAEPRSEQSAWLVDFTFYFGAE